MNTLDPESILRTAYADIHQPDFAPNAVNVSEQGREWLQTIVEEAEHQKAVIAVLFTSLVKKIESPTQDVRRHQEKLDGGYSGRGLDTKIVTPFLQRHFRRLSMAESGWLTRSLEQKAAYTLDYPGAIQNIAVKQAFLQILDDIEEKNADPHAYLLILMFALSKAFVKTPSPPQTQAQDEGERLTVSGLISVLYNHFFHVYRGAGASRLPVLAVYSAYELLMDTPRYGDKRLLPLKGHTTADTKSHSIGDIEIVHDTTGAFFEAVEVKHKKTITTAMIETAKDKIQPFNLARYYILTTAQPNIKADDERSVTQSAEQANRETGCEFILNGIMPSLKYYLRLVPDLNAFVSAYTSNLEKDFAQGTNIKRAHVEHWGELRLRAKWHT